VVGAGASAHRVVTVNKVLAGLTPHSTYVYKVVAKNAGGTTVSSQGSFRTSHEPSERSHSHTPPTPVEVEEEKGPAPEKTEKTETPVAVACQTPPTGRLHVTARVTGHTLTMMGKMPQKNAHLSTYYYNGCLLQQLKTEKVTVRHGKFVIMLRMIHNSKTAEYLVSSHGAH
jgi:hypothetical protein